MIYTKIADIVEMTMWSIDAVVVPDLKFSQSAIYVKIADVTMCGNLKMNGKLQKH